MTVHSGTKRPPSIPIDDRSHDVLSASCAPTPWFVSLVLRSTLECRSQPRIARHDSDQRSITQTCRQQEQIPALAENDRTTSTTAINWASVNRNRFMVGTDPLAVSPTLDIYSARSMRKSRGSSPIFFAYRRRVMLTLKLLERKPPSRAKLSCGQPSMITILQNAIGTKRKGRPPR
jgi:hypothetical protein